MDSAQSLWGGDPSHRRHRRGAWPHSWPVLQPSAPPQGLQVRSWWWSLQQEQQPEDKLGTVLLRGGLSSQGPQIPICFQGNRWPCGEERPWRTQAPLTAESGCPTCSHPTPGERAVPGLAQSSCHGPEGIFSQPTGSAAGASWAGQFALRSVPMEQRTDWEAQESHTPLGCLGQRG